MLTKQTFEILEKNIKNINELAEKYGFTNLRVFKSELASEPNCLNFLVAVDKAHEGKISLSDVGTFQWSLQKLLKCKVAIVQEDELDEVYKDEILEQSIPLSKGSLSAIKKSFGVQLDKQKEAKFPKVISTQKPKLVLKEQSDEVEVTISIPKNGKGKRNVNDIYYLELALEVLVEEKSKKSVSEKSHNRP